MLGGEVGERAVVGRAGARAAPPGACGARSPAPSRRSISSSRARIGAGIDLAHQACRCTASGGARPSWRVMRFASSTASCRASLEPEVVELRLGQRDQRDAERLQLVHFAFALRLADKFVRHAALCIAPPCRSATDSPASRRSCASSRKRCSSARGAAAQAAAIATCREGYGLSVTVRKGKPDTVEHNRDRSLGVSVYLGERPKARRGHASTSDFSPRGARADGRRRARHRAPYRRGRLRRACRTPDLLAREHCRTSISSTRGRCHRGGDRARQALRGGRVRRVAEDQQLRRRQRLGAAVAVRVRQQPRLHRRLSRLAPLPVVLGDRRGQGPDAARRLVQRLARAGRARRRRARSAATPAQRALARLGARKIATGQAPVLFEAPVALRPHRPFRLRR